MILRFYLSFILTLLTVVSAHAQIVGFSAGTNSFSLQLGPTYPTATDRFNRGVGAGPAIRFQYLHYLIDWIALGGEFGYSRLLKKTQKTDTALLFGIPSVTELKLEAQAIDLALIARVNIVEDRSWTPYVLAGGGFHQFDAKASYLPSGSTEPASHKAFSREFETIAAGGIEAFVLKNFSLSFEARWVSLRLSRKRFAVDSVETLSYLFGARYWFGL